MRTLFKLSFLAFFIFGCAKIPVQSIALADALQSEGERMHKLNLVFLNRIFMAKRETIEKFIKEDYAPKVVENMMGKLNEAEFKAKLKDDLPEFTSAVTSVVSQRRDSLVNALELQKEKVVDKLSTDYNIFNNAAFELKRLLESAVKIDKEKQALFNQAKALSANRLDFNGLENTLDKFIHSSGNVGNNIDVLNNAINQLLNTK
jgi:hypothetical protein